MSRIRVDYRGAGQRTSVVEVNGFIATKSIRAINIRDERVNLIDVEITLRLAAVKISKRAILIVIDRPKRYDIIIERVVERQLQAVWLLIQE